ncbi:MAG: VanW family protein [Patescibacteria group bacterium]|nr:VanW family protein [Patescibacteria group bacterium]
MLKKILKKDVKKIWQNIKFRRICLASGLVVVAIAAVFFLFNLIYQDKVFPHTYIGEVNFGGQTRDEAKENLNGIIARSQNSQLNYMWGEKTYSTDLNNLEVNFSNSSDKTVDRLMAVGRTGMLGKILAETGRAIISKNIVYAQFGFNEEKLNDYLTNITKDIDKLEKDATIEIRSDGPVVIPEEIGQKFEMAVNKQIIFDLLGSFDFPANLPFKVSKLVPKIDSKIAQMALPETKDLMKRQLIMKAANKTFELHSDDIVGLIEFVARPAKKNILSTPQNSVSLYVLSPEISAAKLSPFVEKIAQEIYQEPKDPKFQVTDDRVAAFQLEQTGYELEKENATAQIIEAIGNDKSTLDLPVKITKSKVSSDNPEKLGLKELIGEGRTSWRGSPPNRIHNLTLGANNISGTIVNPGEEFSTVKTIGAIDAAAGFLPELVIKNSTQVTPEIGGGLCQVSTTLFRAVLNSGLKITDRSAHSFRVSYYEPPVGMDATIYDPAPDFKFVNNMSTPIFIWAIAGNNSLSFQIYGTKDGRKAEISDPVLYDYVSPGEAVYTQSDSMAAGAIRQTERATSGVSASFKYKVTSANGEVLQEETYMSKYVPIPDSYLYGPGTEGIPNQNPAPAQVEATSVPAPAPTSAPTVQGNTKKKN